MRTRGLVYPLFVAQTTKFGMSDVCSAKRELVERGIERHEGRNGNKVFIYLFNLYLTSKY